MPNHNIAIHMAKRFRLSLTNREVSQLPELKNHAGKYTVKERLKFLEKKQTTVHNALILQNLLNQLEMIGLIISVLLC